jgi:hypothetical protein
MDLITTAKNAATAVYENRGPIFFTGLCAALVVLFLYFFYAPPAATGIGPAQPIPFSHRVHAGTKAISCEFCHPYVDRSAFPGMPPVGKCLYCHNHIIAKHPEILKEHRYYDTNTPTPWVKVNYIPEHVFFKHYRHIRKGVDCAECHGDVETMDRLPRNTFLMGFCIDCHEKRNANLGCWLGCHN